MSAAIPGFPGNSSKKVFAPIVAPLAIESGKNGRRRTSAISATSGYSHTKRRAAVLDEAALDEIVRRHLCRVPFENVSKLLLLGREGAGRVTMLAEFLDGIEHRDLGGTCVPQVHITDARLCRASACRAHRPD